ncbi:hypothetical protein ACYZUD_05040 [Pseudomonas sp. XS1P51]
MSELSALIGVANRQAQFIKRVYLRCVVGAGFYGRGVSEVGLYTLRYMPALENTKAALTNPVGVGAAEGCDLLILFRGVEDQDQRIAAFGSSYRGQWCMEDWDINAIENCDPPPTSGV